jgi:two-component system KDP operon response regulator KdpE
MTRILVVDDERQLLRALSINLRARGYEVDLAETGAQALDRAAKFRPDVVIVDLGLPDLDGTEVVAGLRGWSQVPIIVLSARHTEEAKVSALDAGADDYVTKPFGMDELLARLRATLRRAAASASAAEQPVVETEHFTIDLAATRVTRKRPSEAAGERIAERPDGSPPEGAPGDEEVRLTPTEWQLLELLVRADGKLVTGPHLLHEVWGPQYGTELNYLRQYLAQLRRKLEPEPSNPRYLITEVGMGYRFQR